MHENTSIAVITNVIPKYREDMYARLIDYFGHNIQIYCQLELPGMNLQLAHNKLSNNIVPVRYLGLKKEKLSWQFIPFFKLVKNCEAIFISGNPRVLSNVIYSFLFKAMGKKVVIWGQYHTAGANPYLEKLRLAWWARFDYAFLYTDREASQYRKQYSKVKVVIGMNNGLNQDEITKAKSVYSGSSLLKWQRQHKMHDRVKVLSCARLDKKNKFDIFIECLPALTKVFPSLLWCVIGGGEQEQYLKNKAKELEVSGHIRWLGSIYSQGDLAPWFLSSRLLIHPGAIGLTLLHAMGYGLPVVTHDNRNMHMPEIAALENGYNGLIYKEGDVGSLINLLVEVLRDDRLLRSLSDNAVLTAEKVFNTKIMAERFIKLTKEML